VVAIVDPSIRKDDVLGPAIEQMRGDAHEVLTGLLEHDMHCRTARDEAPADGESRQPTVPPRTSGHRVCSRPYRLSPRVLMGSLVLIPPKILKPFRSQLGVFDRVLDVAMP
jgi:hypothetical protein